MEIPGVYAKTSDWVEGLIARTSPDQLDSDTPCSEWRGRDLIAHLIWGGHTFATILRREQPDLEQSPELMGDDPAKAYRVAADEVLEAMSDPANLEGTVTTPFGEPPATTFCGIAALDHTAHGWDLARCTGQDATIPDDVLTVIDPFARQALADVPRSPQSFLDPIEVDDSASATEQFVAFLGRRP